VLKIEEMVKSLAGYPGVAHCEAYQYMCSDPGQTKLLEGIKDKFLDGVVVAACSPTLHEATFRNAAARAGLNPFMVEIANVREYCSWVHKDHPAEATEKAVRIIRGAVEKVRQNQSLTPIKVSVHRKCMVIGAGISGIQAALDVANAGFDVILVEKSPTIGGRMAQLSETFPTLDCSQCILTPKMVEVARHPRIKLYTNSEIQEVTGSVGNFHVKINQKAQYVDPDKCNLCGDCVKACPVLVPSEFDRGMSLRKAIYIPFPQAVPSTYTLDENYCLGLNPLRCSECARVCQPGAIDYCVSPRTIEADVGTIVVATGYDLYPKERIAEYGYGVYPDVVDGLQFERLLSASGPTSGEVRRPSDNTVPKDIVFIQCAGSRDERHNPYCSKICCMYTAKHALLYKHRVPDGQAYIFYIDIRAAGKDYEEFVQRAMEEDRILYLRGKVSKVFQQGGKLMVWGVDTLTGSMVEIPADMVVLATSMIARKSTGDVTRKLKIASDEDGYLKEAHPKLRPIESLTSGIYLAGSSQGPKDIPEAVAQGSGAAAKVVSILSSDELVHDPMVSDVEEVVCGGCGICISVCPYGALSLDERRNVALVNEVLCEGCGTCAASCPTGAAEMRNYTSRQVMDMICAALST
jgi:heterodisulfide reductase subunit A